MCKRGPARDQKNVGRAAEQPGERNLHRGGIEALSHIGWDGRLQRGEASEWKEWHIGDAVVGKLIDQRIVCPMRQVVVVLHADYLADPASLLDLRRRNVA